MATAVAIDLDLDPGGKGVDHRHTHSVQPAGDLVAAAAELAPRVQHGEHDFRRGQLGILGMTIHGDTPSIVDHLAPTASHQFHLDPGGMAGHGFIHRVVDDLIDEVVQPARSGGADIHTRTFTDRFESLENLDVSRVVGQAALLLLIVLLLIVAPAYPPSRRAS